MLGDVNIHFDKTHESLTKQTIEILHMYSLQQIVDKPTHRRGHTINWIVTRDDDSVHKSSHVSDALESDHVCVVSLFYVTPFQSASVYRYVRNVSEIDRCACETDLTAQSSSC